MADITKCRAEGCPAHIKETCKRFTAKADPLYQSFFTEVPGKWVNVPDPDIKKSYVWECDMYWGDKSESIWQQLKNIVK